MRLLTIIESPFNANRTRCKVCGEQVSEYLRRCLRDSWDRGELPYASHGFFPSFLNEDVPEERKAGIFAGYEMWAFAERIAFYTDYDVSPGMEQAIERNILAAAEAIPYEYRKIGRNPNDLPKTHRTVT